MKQETSVALVKGIMTDFARLTGLSPATDMPRRYLWTDAFAVCNFLGLYQETGDKEFKDLALKLVDQVHSVLGRHRHDDQRTGWISGLDEEAGRLHKRIEKIEQVARLRDELAGDVDKLYGVAITPSVGPGAVQLWFMARGYWLPGHRFGFEVPGGKAVSMDQRLRELVAALEPPQAQLRERQEHIALLARWYYSTWRDGEWLQFGSFEHAPYRKMVRAISRIVATGVKPPVS